MSLDLQLIQYQHQYQLFDFNEFAADYPSILPDLFAGY